MFGTESGWGSGMGLGMWFLWIAFVVIIIALVGVFPRDRGNSSTVSRESPLEILKSRYARGEIDEEEFERRRRDLDKQ